MLRMTLTTLLTLRALLEIPQHEAYGRRICAQAHLPSGTVHPILVRLEDAGWAESCWEDPATAMSAGRPRRRYYKLTETGREAARLARDDLAARLGLGKDG